jgi:isopenicillin-N N-acyltransferase-like protein
MFSDGCTALSWRSGDGSSSSFLAQNWDWEQEQAPNLVRLTIYQPPKPSIDMITEAGIIGKIGLNSSGVGVCLNAIRAIGVDFYKVPCHLALRSVLDSQTAREAVDQLLIKGVASSCHILAADLGTSFGLECSHSDIQVIDESPISGGGTVLTHTNHYLAPHSGVEDIMYLLDSPRRLQRIDHLVRSGQDRPTSDSIHHILKDEHGYPVSICRSPDETSSISTLFSIVMDLRQTLAIVTLGRGLGNGEQLILAPQLR